MPFRNLEETVRSHGAFVRNLARRLVLGDDKAGDLEQQTWLAAMESPPRRAGVRGWLATVVRNFARRAHRAEVRREHRESVAARPEAISSAADVVQRQAVIRQVIDAVFALEEPYRSTLLLHFYENLQPAEIAEQLGVPAATVRTRLKRGLDQLRDWFDARHGGDRDQWTMALMPVALGALKPVVAAAAAAGAGAALTTAAASTTPITALGGIIVAKKIGIALGACCVLAVSVIVWKQIVVAPDPVDPGTVSVREVPSTERTAFNDGGKPVTPIDGAKVTAKPFVPTGDEMTPSAMAIAAGKPTARITGRVVDEEGRPVADAAVTMDLSESRSGVDAVVENVVEGGDNRTTRTTTDGRFHFAGVPVDFDASVHVKPTTLCDANRTVPVTKPVDVDMGDLVAKRGGTLAGQVLGPTGAPIKGAKVRAWTPAKSGSPGIMIFGGGFPGGGEGRSTVTDADGRYRIEGIAEGPCSAAASAEDCQVLTRTGLRVTKGQVTWEADFKLAAGTVIEGVVRNPDGKPVAGARVSARPAALTIGVDRGGLSGERREVVTGADGRFVVRGLSDEPQAVRARVPGFLPGDAASVPPGTTDLVLALRPSALVWGILADSTNGRPVADFTASTGTMFFGPNGGPGTRVWKGAEAAQAANVADQPGLFAVTDVPESGMTLRFVAKGYGTTSFETKPTPGEKIEIKPRLIPECVVSGLVVDPSGNPVAGARVVVATLKPERDEARDAGPTGVRVARRVVRREVVAGSPGGGGLKIEETPSNGSAETGPDGSFRIGGLREGEFTIVAMHREYADVKGDNITLKPGAPLENLKLSLMPAGKLAGTALDADGRPLAGAKVYAERQTEGGANGPGNEFDFGSDLRQTAVADARGHYEITALMPGDYRAGIVERPRGGGMVMFMGNGSRDGAKTGTEVKIEAGKTTTQDLRQAPKGGLAGVIREAGKPAVGVKVSLAQDGLGGFVFGGGMSTTTDDAGAYSFEGVDPGNYDLSVDPPGAAQPIARPTTIAMRQETRLDVDLPTGSIEGVIVDKNTRKPVAGLEVKAQPASKPGEQTRTVRAFAVSIANNGDEPQSITFGSDNSSVRTDEAGHFVLKYLEAKDYVVSAEGNGYMKTSKDSVTVEEGKATKGVNLDTEKGATIIVTPDLGGKTASFFLGELSLVDAKDEESKHESGSPRKPIKFTGLKAGRYRIRVHVPQDGDEELSGETTIDVAPGAEMKVPLRLN